MNQAVLVIDVQHALSHGVYPCFDADRVIERINAVCAKARAAGVPVMLIQHQSVGGALDQGSEGWQLAAGLEVQPGDIRLGKTAADAFHKTELQALLQRLGVERLVVCGFQSEFCVDTTVRRALGLGYPVTLVADGHSTLDNGLLSAAQISAHHNLTLAHISSFGLRVTSVAAAEICFADQGQPPVPDLDV
ncbi:cysteine hydrolase family protein [Paucibacter sp. PLA-PC-4]|uniref:cysteine hydrolase family protein n=1 Tax=Paucibacter sp. PLA-PC-4 TaxID=2993655 RepID=UPI002248DA0A|nr:cysteine hydrolase family protein [Paucibacter sp. PLA-PC-4]MCX2860547.1 cysteine hydrolase family protein [Paucibacter sp. PLA-PC-4]